MKNDDQDIRPSRADSSGNGRPVEGVGGKPHGFSLARFALISQFTGELVAFVLLGLAADYKFGWSPWGVVGFGTFGISLAMYHLIRGVLTPPQ